MRPQKAQIHLKFERTLIMGALNVTPDSFSDGGKFFSKKDAIARAIQMARDGADIIDIGGESTRPGASDVDVAEEARRVVPVIEGIRRKLDIPLSVDTKKSRVAVEALRAGADIINDVSGLKNDDAMADVVASHSAALIVMHMKGTPQDMQAAPRYRNLINEIIGGLRESLAIARRAGIAKNKIIIDPGIGFGKTVGHNLEILNRLKEFKVLKCPICVGTSRKSFIGKVLDIADPAERLTGTIASCVIAIMNGANIIRVHDIKEARAAALTADSVMNTGAHLTSG